MKTVAVIPARYASSRMPGKPLMDINGKPMIWWIYQECCKYNKFEKVVVATDNDKIFSVCQELGMNALMTSEDHDTPTSRLCEVATKIDAKYYLCVMGDEPLINRKCFDLITSDENVGDYQVVALTNEISNPADVIDFSNQKVVTNEERRTLLISRSPIPYPKGSLDITYEKVTGIQLFSKNALEFYAKTPKSVLEKAEENDLMRFVEHGIGVKMIVSPYKTCSVDTPKDLEYVRNVIKNRTNVQNGGVLKFHKRLAREAA